jgi:RNA polymerase sigma factor (TIGR02999 family)
MNQAQDRPREREHGPSAARWFELAYADLHELAERLLRRERPDHTLQATALVHEAWLRLAHAQGVELDRREHFFAAAATTMRRVLVNHALARKCDKRGGDTLRVALDADVHAAEERGIDLVELDEALDALAGVDPRAARVVELRFFARLTEAQVAELLDTSERGVRREWSAAKAFLRSRLPARARHGR